MSGKLARGKPTLRISAEHLRTLARAAAVLDGNHLRLPGFRKGPGVASGGPVGRNDGGAVSRRSVGS